MTTHPTPSRHFTQTDVEEKTGRFDYKNALKKSILFYEAQMSGELPNWHRIPWRRDSAVNDGSDRSCKNGISRKNIN